VIEVKNLYHDYTGKGTYAVRDVSFQIEEGEIFGAPEPLHEAERHGESALLRRPL
jgi:ABC-type Na+ transport system ATPase subunit NatA